MLYIYLFVCGAMIIFNIITAVLFRKSERKTEKVSKDLRYEVVLRPKRSPSKRARNLEEFVLDYVDPSNPVPDDEKDEDE